jgi:hypothetical protein
MGQMKSQRFASRYLLLCCPGAGTLLLAIGLTIGALRNEEPITLDTYSGLICLTLPIALLALILWCVPSRRVHAATLGGILGLLVMSCSCGIYGYLVDARDGNSPLNKPRTLFEEYLDGCLAATCGMHMGVITGVIAGVLFHPGHKQSRESDASRPKHLSGW